MTVYLLAIGGIRKTEDGGGDSCLMLKMVGVSQDRNMNSKLLRVRSLRGRAWGLTLVIGSGRTRG